MTKHRVGLAALLGVAMLGGGCSPATDDPTPAAGQEGSVPGAPAQGTIRVTEENYASAETARNFRNWMKLGANEKLVHLREFPPRGKAAPTVQMNDDTLYSVAITESLDGRVEFSIPEVDVYLSVQVVTEGGHGQHYVVDAGDYDLPVETRFALLIYRTGTEKGLEATRLAQDEVQSDMLAFGTYELPNFDWSEIESWTARLTAETQGKPFSYTFPGTDADVTDRHQWNLENANGWGGSFPVVNVSNKYVNSVQFDAGECRTTTFEDPESRFFTSFTAYDEDRYLMEGVKHVSSYSWQPNSDGTITISFNCGDAAINNIDTKGNRFSFTARYYGVTQRVIDGEIAPEESVHGGQP